MKVAEEVWRVAVTPERLRALIETMPSGIEAAILNNDKTFSILG